LATRDGSAAAVEDDGFFSTANRLSRSSEIEDEMVSPSPRFRKGGTEMGFPDYPAYEQTVNLQDMATASGIVFREATTCDDMRQVCALNHRTFAEELGQHPAVTSGLLIDRFHDSNRYFIAAQGEKVVGMVSVHAGPEYSVARRLSDPRALKQYPGALEVRLLAIAQHVRNRTILAGLIWMIYEFAVTNRYSHLLISGLLGREPMYRKLGFQPLGPAVQEGAASFIPMVMDIRDYSVHSPERVENFGRYWARSRARQKPRVLLLPGPVNIHLEVKRSLLREPLSHRSEDFISMFEETRANLRALVPGLDVTMFPGAGTLANDLVAANLKAIFGKTAGIVISNGEFGERLAAQATRAGLVFKHLQFNWGDAWDLSELRNSVHDYPAWIWAVHLETSTGVLNDLNALLSLSSMHESFVALDCVSSLGAVPMPSSRGALHLLTGVSGKSIGSYAGIGFVYLSDRSKCLLRDKALSPSFDLIRMAETRGSCSTFPSPLLLALREALRQHYISASQRLSRFSCYESLGKLVRRELRASGLPPICAEDIAAPNITTFRLPEEAFVSECLRAGYQIAHQSSYLQIRGMAQIATMGNVSRKDLEALTALLRSRASKVSPCRESEPANPG
jgi:aspartate aminotransferase-like enzyme